MALPGKMPSGFGVLEYWSIGVLEKAKALNSISISPFITPLLHHSITPAYCRMRKRPLKPTLGLAQSRVLRARILYSSFDTNVPI